MAKMTRMQRARSRLALHHCFYATILMSTPYVERRDIPTAATDMEKIYYNPDFIESLNDNVVMFVLVHEVMHIILKHGLRTGNRDRQKANLAQDYAINIMLCEQGFELWEHCLHDRLPDYPDGAPGALVDFRGLSFEQIYELLPDPPEDPSGGRSGGYGEGMAGDVLATPSMNPSEISRAARRIDAMVARGAAIARAAGQLPKGLERVIDGVLNPAVPWEAVLRDYMIRSTSNDNESWARRDRRFRYIVLPTMYSEHMGELVMIGDTSGSIDARVFARVAAEITYLANELQPERIRMVWADDTECSREEIFEPGDEIVLHPVGGGGTDMRRPAKFVERYAPEVVVMVTDGYTPWMREAPPYPLIILCTTDAPCPEFAQVIRVTV
jgi:predicted metal-dependent peptidase